MKQSERGRIVQMKEVIGEKADLLIDRRLKKMEKSLASDKDAIWRDLESALKKLASDKTKGNLIISFLRSSYILNSQEFYIAYYEGEPFVEEEPDCIYLNMKRAFSGMVEAANEYYNNLQQNGEKYRQKAFLENNTYEAIESAILEKLDITKDKNKDGIVDYKDLEKKSKYQETYDFLKELAECQDESERN